MAATSVLVPTADLAAERTVDRLDDDDDVIAKLLSIFPSLTDIIPSIVAQNGGALVPSILQLIEMADENETANCFDELEAALQHAAVRDEALGHNQKDLDEQVAWAMQADHDEQLALALQQSLDADAAAAQRSARPPRATAEGAADQQPAPVSNWRRKLVSKLSPSEVGQLVDRMKKSNRYRSRTGVALLDTDDSTANNDEMDNVTSADRAYEPPTVPLTGPLTGPPPAGFPPPAGAPSSALYESRVQRARTSNERPKTTTRSPPSVPPLAPTSEFVDLSLTESA